MLILKNMLKVYNTLSRKKEIFNPLKNKTAGIYSCGPTVYWYQHIGNLRSYIFSDILKRVLLYDGYKVKQVINITDVGHLTSDADEGEDKVESAAKKEGKTAGEISNYYFGIFKKDFDKLNILEPNVWCKATEHIKEQIDLIKKLEKKGYTYKTSDGIYFDTSKFSGYGELAGLKKIKPIGGKRVGLKEKKNPADFSLWKFSNPAGVRQQEWQSPWGIGFPGWHIECSAMSMKYLGPSFDIHTGGEEHIAVHHTNEIAQSEAATGKGFVKYWMHGRWLLFRGEKMSKSKGEIYTISELEKKGFSPLAFRYLCLTARYRTPLEFSFENLKGAQNSYEHLKNLAAELKDDKKINKKILAKFEAAINDDLDMPKALSILWGMVKDKKADGKMRTIKEMDKIFGLDLLKKEKGGIGDEIKNLAAEREMARAEKDWQKADKIRKKIEEKGYKIEDTETGPIIKKTG